MSPYLRERCTSALRSTKEFLEDIQASDNPACDPESSQGPAFLALLSEVRAVLAETEA